MIRHVPAFDDSVEDELTLGMGTEGGGGRAYSVEAVTVGVLAVTAAAASMLAASLVTELYPEELEVLEVVDPVLVKGVGLLWITGGARELRDAAASIGAGRPPAALGDLWQLAARIMIRRASSLLW